jgi:hypothetical protein
LRGTEDDQLSRATLVRLVADRYPEMYIFGDKHSKIWTPAD